MNLVMCLKRSAWRRLGKALMQALVVLLICGTVIFANSAGAQQSQDYFNGMMSEQNKALSDRVGNLEKVLYFVLAATFGVLITNIMGLRNQTIDRKQSSDDRAADEDRRSHRRRIITSEDTE